MIPLTYEMLLFLVLILAGIIIVVVVIRAVIHFLPPIVAAVVVWLYTQNLIMAGTAFVLIALLQLALRRR